jgi:capsular polysaccharide transport system permease protein
MLHSPLATRSAAPASPPPVSEVLDHSLERGLVIPFAKNRTPRVGSPASSVVAHARFLPALSFVLVVLLPIGVAAAYYFAIAADQYVAEFRFNLRTAEQRRTEPFPFIDGNSQYLPAAAESHVVAQYIVSRAMVDELGKAITLRLLFAPPEADWWARLDQPASIEALVEYWRKQVDAFYDPANGTTTVRVRAFSRQDALRLAQAVIGAAERLINEMSARARKDTVQHAEQGAAEAEQRLRSALAQIRDFRSRKHDRSDQERRRDRRSSSPTA